MSHANLSDGWPRELRLRCPASLPEAIDCAAGKRLTNRSAYVREAVIERLRADGIDLAQFQSAGADVASQAGA